jgi:hypothetical protein
MQAHLLVKQGLFVAPDEGWPSYKDRHPLFDIWILSFVILFLLSALPNHIGHDGLHGHAAGALDQQPVA